MRTLLLVCFLLVRVRLVLMFMTFGSDTIGTSQPPSGFIRIFFFFFYQNCVPDSEVGTCAPGNDVADVRIRA